MDKRLYIWNYIFHPMYPDFSLEDERNYLLKLVTAGFDLPDGYIKVPVLASNVHTAISKRDRLLKLLNDVTGKKHFVVLFWPQIS